MEQKNQDAAETGRPVESKRKIRHVMVFADETLEDLQRGNFRLIQKKDGFRYGEDAVLLTHFAARQVGLARGKRSLSYLDLGSQCGIITILFQAVCPQAQGIGLELFPRQVDVMRRNIRLNSLEASLRTVQADIRSLSRGSAPLPEGIKEYAFDMVICNPPYGVPARGFDGRQETAGRQETEADLLSSVAYEKRAAREEVAVSFKEICGLVDRLLKPQGRFVFSHRPDRLPELMADLDSCRLTPKDMLLVQPEVGKKPTTVLLSAVKHGRPGSFNLAAPLPVRDQNRLYTEAMRAFIGRTTAYEARPEDPVVCFEETGEGV